MYSPEDDPHGLFAAAKKDFNLTCTQRNAAGKLFWGPMGQPHNRRYTLPTGSKFDNEWIQLVSWKGSIAKDQMIRDIQKSTLQKRLDPPPYPPMLAYQKDGSVRLTTKEQVKQHELKQTDPRLLKMKETLDSCRQAAHVSPLDGCPKGDKSNRSSNAPRRSTTVPPLRRDDWRSTYTVVHGVPEGAHTPRAMGAATCAPMHPTHQQMAHALGRCMKPKINDRQRKMWPEHPPNARCKDLGLVIDRNEPRYSFSRLLAKGCSDKLRHMQMPVTRGREIWAASHQGWSN